MTYKGRREAPHTHTHTHTYIHASARARLRQQAFIEISRTRYPSAYWCRTIRHRDRRIITVMFALCTTGFNTSKFHVLCAIRTEYSRTSLIRVNRLTPKDHCRGRTAPLTSKRFILYIYSTNIGNEYFKHGIYSPFFPLQNACSFIILTYLVPVLFTFYIQVC